MLKEAGYENGLELTIVLGAGDTLRTTAAELMQASLEEVGIKLNISFLDISAYASTTLNDVDSWDIWYRNFSNGNYCEPSAASFFAEGGTVNKYAPPNGHGQCQSLSAVGDERITGG